MEVIAVVVTCNRINLLKGVLRNLLSQTFSLKQIVIVDNASTDGTVDYLKALNYDVIDCIFNEINEGGAGGFYRGIKKAYENGCDAVWIMDDDTFPTETALAELIDDYRYLQHSGSKVGFITSNAVWKDGKPCLMNISNPEFIWNEHISHSLVRVKHSSFVAMMVPTSVIADVGLPVKEFFIWGDDGEYSTRIAAKYEGYMSGKSVVYHMMSENVGVNIFNTPENRINRFYYFYRNWMFTNRIRGKGPARQFIKDTNNLIRSIKKSNTPHKREKIATIRKGLRDGKKFDAHIEKVNSPSNNIGNDAPEVFSKHKNELMHSVISRAVTKWPNTDYGYIQFQYNRYKRMPESSRSDLNFLFKGLGHSKICNGENRSKSFLNLMRCVEINPIFHGPFVTSIDYYKNWCILFRQMDNAPVDYDLVLENGLMNLYLNEDNGFSRENDCVLDAIIEYVNKLRDAVLKEKVSSSEGIASNLNNFIYKKAESLEDGLQRIILVTQILWQTGHYLIGLGRLDKLLDEIISSDPRNDDEILPILKDFITTMHEYYWYKSSALMGDTGQIIILGGLESDGTYFANRLTYLFIDAVQDCNLPDPKILLRVSIKMPDDLIIKAVHCISTGIGSPLLANDDVIVEKLVKFGYDESDAFDYKTSACWEPIPGNCFEQNNIAHVNFVEPFKLVSDKEILSDISSFKDYLRLYKNHLFGHTEYICNSLNDIIWEFDPVVSAFLKPCRERRMDVSVGGEKYNNYGILTNGLSNAVNSLLTLKKLVFDEGLISLREFDHQLIENYTDGNLHDIAVANSDYFGHDDDAVVCLVNELLNVVSDAASKYHNKFGGTVKIGTSSPSYITIGKSTRASFDGRLEGDPFGVHISGKGTTPFTEIFNFASKINYGGNKFNGNVVDIVTSPNFIRDNESVFINLIKLSINNGFFETQFNVLSSDLLKNALENPDNYPDLIVRVWGFSAYFVDLPKEYQLLLIKRAEENESQNN